MKARVPHLAGAVMVTLLTACGTTRSDTHPERRNIIETVFASGVLLPEDQYNLTAQTDGYLISLTFDEGDLVSTGDMLAIVDDPTADANSIAAAQLLEIARGNYRPDAPAMKQVEANMNAAKQKMEQDEIQVGRYKALFEANSVSQLEYENMKLVFGTSQANYIALQQSYDLQQQQAQQQLISQRTQSDVSAVLKGRNAVRAVVGGKVYLKHKELGDYVRRGEVIAVIGAPRDLYAELSIDESSIAKVKAGQRVVVQLNTDTSRTYAGVIRSIHPSFDSKSQSFSCEVQFTDTLEFLVSGTQVQANIIVLERTDVLVIPRGYLDHGNTVLVKGEGKITIVPGFVSNEWVEVIGGIDANTTIQREDR